MIRRTLLVLTLWATTSVAFGYWHSVLQISIGGAPAGYTGPGDYSTSPQVWGGLRGFNTADVADPADVCLPADAVCAHLTLSSGNVVVPASLSTCNITTVLCTVKNLFDKSGNANDFNIASSIAARPIFVPAFTANGCSTTALPCMQFTGTQKLCTFNTLTVAQPFVYSLVGLAASSAANGAFVIDAGTQVELAVVPTATWNLYAGASVGVSAADGAFHAAQAKANGASSELYIDGVSTTGNASTNSISSNAICLGMLSGGTQPLIGRISEVGIFGTVSNSAMNANQRAYWGF